MYDSKLVGSLAIALNRLGCEEAMVVNGLCGLDEISTLGKTVISHLRNGEIRTFQIAPKDLGLKQARLQDLLGGSPKENACTMVRILNGNCSQQEPKTEIVLANSAAAIVLGGKAETLKEGLQAARESIRSGAALRKLEG